MSPFFKSLPRLNNLYDGTSASDRIKLTVIWNYEMLLQH
jgi:hypothetical protein